jgi:8-hydroxy-5-deazaflavin:NADPH oxidoreductase
MRFRTIGAGEVALAFARKALATGHEVVLSNRHGPDSLAGKVAELGRGASAAGVQEAANLDYVLLAVPWPSVENALKGQPAWNGRVLIGYHRPRPQGPDRDQVGAGSRTRSRCAAGARHLAAHRRRTSRATLRS